MINNPIIYKFFKDFTNHRKKANRAVAFSCRPFPNILKYKDQFHQKLIDKQTEYEPNPNFLFAEPNKFILDEIPFFISNENIVKRFLDKLQYFAHHKFDIAVKWSTNKIRSLFCLKDKNMHLACKIYEICFYSTNYIGETKRNLEARWNKRENPNKDSEPAKTSEKFLIISSIGKYFSRHLKTRNYVRSWNHQ